MTNKALTTPVLFTIFNRPETARRVFNEIRKVKPLKFFVAADGPREDRKGEMEKCQAVRELVKQVDWECEVFTNFREKNRGLKKAISSAIDWFFANVEEGIILEDDCLPHPIFFRFCEELLERYREDKRVMVISGDNFLFGRKRANYSYYFSRYNHCWGWATWRRAWINYDGEMRIWPEIKDGDWLKDILVGSDIVRYWFNIFQLAYVDKIDSWAYPWTFSCLIQNGLSILPNVNLVSNIGFGSESTHTKGSSRFANMAVEAMDFPLKHPPFVIRDARADDFVQRSHFDISNAFFRVIKKNLMKGKKYFKK